MLRQCAQQPDRMMEHPTFLSPVPKRKKTSLSVDVLVARNIITKLAGTMELDCQAELIITQPQTTMTDRS